MVVRQTAKSSGSTGDSNNNTTSFMIEPGRGGGTTTTGIGGRLGGGGGGNSSSTSSIRSRLPDTLDVFGFMITPSQFIMLQLVATFMLGFHGTLAFLGCLIVYHIFQRYTGDNGSSSSGNGGGSNNQRGGRLGGGGGRPNIKGVSDLPPDPRGG